MKVTQEMMSMLNPLRVLAIPHLTPAIQETTYAATTTKKNLWWWWNLRKKIIRVPKLLNY